VYTALHGAAGAMAASVFYKAGFRNFVSVPLQSEPDMRFPTVTAPNPENPDNLKIALNLALEENAELVLANDGDGDRIGLAWKENDTFYIPGGNEIGTMLLYYLLKKMKEQNKLSGKEFAVSTIVSTPLTKAICEYFQISYHETLTGFKWMGNLADKLVAEGNTFMYAFEEAFGVTFGNSRDKDGLTAILLAANLHEETGFSQLKEEMIQLFGLRLEGAVEKEYPGTEGKQIMNGILDKLRSDVPTTIGNYKIITVRDILKRTVTTEGNILPYEKLPVQNLLYFHLNHDAWAALRPSGTEPKLKIYFGINAGKDGIEKARQELGLLQKELEKLLA
jgi:phosphoglucomutase